MCPRCATASASPPSAACLCTQIKLRQVLYLFCSLAVIALFCQTCQQNLFSRNFSDLSNFECRASSIGQHIFNVCSWQASELACMQRQKQLKTLGLVMSKVMRDKPLKAKAAIDKSLEPWSCKRVLVRIRPAQLLPDLKYLRACSGFL